MGDASLVGVGRFLVLLRVSGWAWCGGRGGDSLRRLRECLGSAMAIVSREEAHDVNAKMAGLSEQMDSIDFSMRWVDASCQGREDKARERRKEGKTPGRHKGGMASPPGSEVGRSSVSKRYNHRYEPHRVSSCPCTPLVCPILETDLVTTPSFAGITGSNQLGVWERAVTRCKKGRVIDGRRRGRCVGSGLFPLGGRAAR